MDKETVWLTQEQICTLFDRDRSVVTKHINNVFKEGELVRDSVCAKFAHTAAVAKNATVQQEGGRGRACAEGIDDKTGGALYLAG